MEWFCLEIVIWVTCIECGWLGRWPKSSCKPASSEGIMPTSFKRAMATPSKDLSLAEYFIENDLINKTRLDYNTWR